MFFLMLIAYRTLVDESVSGLNFHDDSGRSPRAEQTPTFNLYSVR
jgi:hypothetical protein